MIAFEKMRPCIKKYLQEGLRDKLPRELFREQRKKMTFAIIHDLNRIGCDEATIKNELLSWNDRNLSPLSPGDARRQLSGFVDWMLKRDCKLSCKGLNDFCIFPGGSGCAFQKKAVFEPLNYAIGQARIYLERNYPLYGNGYRMTSVLEAIREKVEQTGHNPVFIGLREICSLVYKNRQFRIEPKEVLRDIHRLRDEGFLEITEKGLRGEYGFRAANGYRLLNWIEPERIITH